MIGFPKKHRLSSKADFQFVFAKPHKIKHKSLVALYRANQKLYSRLGMVISKSIIKRAIDRNRIHRIIRERFRSHHETLTGLDIIVLIRSEWCALDKKSLREDIDQLWPSKRLT